MKPRQIPLKDDPEWFKDAVVYQLHVKAFRDSDGNGIGDFQGLLSKLDYLQDLGVTAIWLLPFYPSPLRDDGYDIADYFDVNSDYGTLRDFQEFLKSAHYRGMRVITELVINHTSDQHRWFQLARRSRPGSEMREYYVWSDTPAKYRDARIIFKDFEASNWTWDQVAGAYYWHRFYSHQPDLNFDSPRVQKAIFKILDFWFGMGVDGLRLDAVPYLFEREGTNCENLPETHEFLKKLRSYVDANYSNRLLLAEANQWPEDAVAYFGDDDECHMAFHFPIMPRLFMALWMEDRFPLLDILEQTPPIPEGSQWAMFLRNHDELTLEMVTDEERDYMYRIYAKDPRARINLGIRRRLAPLLNNNRRKIELMNFLLFSLPGTPIIYYGDEIGMGDNYFLGDRNGVRTPMQWSPDRNAGFSSTNPQHLYLPVIMDPEYHFEVVNVENQDKNVSSLLWWMRRVIAMRRNFRTFGRGDIRFLLPDNPKVLAFLREYENEVVLVVINLSRFAQVAELDLSEFAGRVPVELFSGNRFPRIEEHPYLFTLGIHDYFWFSLHKEEDFVHPSEMGLPEEIVLEGSWEEAMRGVESEKLERILPAHITLKRWFRSKARVVRTMRIREDIPLGGEQHGRHRLLLLEVHYTEGASELYVLPVTFVADESVAQDVEEQQPQAVITRIRTPEAQGVLLEGVFSEAFRTLALDMIVHNRRFHGMDGDLAAWRGTKLERPARGQPAQELSSQVLKAEQSNTSFLYGGSYFLKLYRKVEEGVNPDAEIVAHLTEKEGFPNVPPFLGQIEYRRSGSETLTLGMLQQFVANQGDAWSFAQDNLEHYFEHVLSRKSEFEQAPGIAADSLFGIGYGQMPQVIADCIGGYFLETMAQLGQITAEMHLALGRAQEDPAFVPEPFSKLYQRSVYQSMRNLTRRTMESLRRNLFRLPEGVRDEAGSVLHREQRLLQILSRITEHKIEAMKIRIHGDYHLGQVLRSGNNFLIIDFEGEPARPLSERRLKRSCFKDVAGMIRSFHYAAYSALFNQSSIRAGDVDYLRSWVTPWYQAVSGLFLRSYMQTMGDSPLVPQNKRELELMFDIFLLEKAVYELGYELNNRPDWISIPVRGIVQIMEGGG
jgi:maltose alpha-D-glucosyltransferase/alpha-amylase